MSFVKRIVLLALLCAVSAPIVGCGIGSTAADNRRMIAQVADTDARMLVDDLMLFAQTDRPFRTNRMVISH